MPWEFSHLHSTGRFSQIVSGFLNGFCDPLSNITFQEISRLFNPHPAAVDAQIIITGISPFSLYVIVVVHLTLAILLFDHILRFFLRQVVKLHNTCSL